MSCNKEAKLKQITWENFTPLLVRAERIGVKKSKIDAKGVVTEDTRNWVLSEIIWRFSPAKTPVHSMMISTVDAKGAPLQDAETETFDFLSGAFKFYYNEETNGILGEIEVMEAGFAVTYRYDIIFYGQQAVSAKDLLVSQSLCTNTGIRSINSVISL